MIILGCSWCLGPLQAAAKAKPSLLSDRAAGIVNATPFYPGNFIIPGGLSGKGQLIGIADNGLDRGSLSDIHPDLSSDTGQAPRISSLKSVSGRAIPDDPSGHGTHMAGVLVGSGKSSQGKYHGIAPDSSLYFQALLDEDGELRIPANLAELYDPAYQAGVRVYVNGWGNPGNSYRGYSRQTDSFIAEHPDFLVLFGAGNNGPAQGSLSAEANSKNALVVGASQLPRPGLDMDSVDASQVLSSSSRGPTADGRIKPDLLAPGANIVGTCSSLVTSNFESNPAYITMSGTSMASAVAAGAVALLREYLETHRHLDHPSAALIKALLINGARFDPNNISSQGFGILDLAGTILPVKDRTVEYVNQASLSAQETREYHISLDKAGGLFKATLAWTDPPSEAGASKVLVNNLDLVVKDPEGKLHYGNDFSGSGRIDSTNNVEQVVISNAREGEYTIYVKAASLAEGFTRQSYALVYGQAMQHETVAVESGGKLVLTDGTAYTGSVDYDQTKTILTADRPEAKIGGELYWNDKNSYLFLQTWESGGVQMLTTSTGSLIMEVNPQAREGGYYLDRQWQESRQVQVNGQAIDNSHDFPTGAHINAVVNPLYQVLWQANAAAAPVEGYIKKVDYATRQIWLINDDQPYRLYPGAAINVSNSIAGSIAEAIPYGFAQSVDLEGLLPGMKVKMVITPKTRWVNYITVQRDLVIARVTGISLETETLNLNNGGSYTLFPGTQIYRDGIEARLKDIQPGDYVVGMHLPGLSRFLQLEAYSQVAYGRVIYFNDNTQTLYFFNQDNQIQECQLNQQTSCFRSGSLLSKPAFEPGSWVRVLLAPDGSQALRVDEAAIAETAEKTLVKYDAVTQMFVMDDDSLYQCLPSTLVSSGGFALSPEDMIEKRKVRLITLAGEGGKSYLAAIEGDQDTGAAAPRLEVKAEVLNGALIIRGETDADRIVVYRQDQSRVRLEPEAGGRFNRLLLHNPGEDSIKVVAINTANGAVYAREVAVAPFSPPRTQFTDIQDSNLAQQVMKLAEEGIIQGYDDGTFRPYASITRLELVSLLARYLQLDNPSIRTGFADDQLIPWWGKGWVEEARRLGLIKGYEDGSFRPQQAATRSEMAIIMDKAYRLLGTSQGRSLFEPAGDILLAPEWAQPAILKGYQRGIWPDTWQSVFKPQNYLTRGEAVLLISRLEWP
jgi:subtilisin family serine protease